MSDSRHTMTAAEALESMRAHRAARMSADAAVEAVIHYADGLAACAGGDNVKAAMLFARAVLLNNFAAAKTVGERFAALDKLRAFEAKIAEIGNRARSA